MAFKIFGNVPTTAYRPDYLRNEERQTGKYGRFGTFHINFTVSGPLFINPDQHLRKAVEAALEATAIAGKRFVIPDTPIDTGLLRSRWYHKKVTWNEFRLSNDIFYAPFNERRVQMLERNIPKIQSELTKNLDREIPNHLN